MMMPSIFGENLFDDWMDFPFDDDFFRRTPSYSKKSSTSVMRTDIRDTDDSYELDVDLPGYKKDEINVQLKEGYLTISASKNTENDEKDKKGNYIRRERYNGTMSRSFYVGDAIHQDDIHAKYADGILKISVPKKTKKEVEQANYISIEG